MSIIKSGTTNTTAYSVDANTDGDLVFIVSESLTAMTISASGAVTFSSGGGFDIASANITNLTATTLTVSAATYLASASGSVGIGTTNPGAKLATISATPLYAGSDATGGSYMGYVNSAPSASVSCYFGWLPESIGTSGVNGDLGFFPRSNAGASVRFFTGNPTPAERLRIDSAGNAGLGVIPSAWASVRKVVQLPGGAFIQGRTDLNQTLIGNNFFSDGSFKYIANGFASGYEQAIGGHFWYIAGSGTAGNTVSLTEAMVLNASGNLGVGTTSPAAKLSVSFTNSTAPTSGTTPAGIGVSFGAADGNNGGIWFSAELGGAQGISGIAGTRTSGYQTDLRFYTNNTNATGAFTERARITSGGITIFGSTGSVAADANKCFVDPNASAEGGRYTAVGNNSGGGALFLGARSDTQANTILIRPDGDLENANNSYGAISDERLKQDIVDASSQWDDIKGIRVRKYRFKSDPHLPPQIGVIAQELETVSPGLVAAENDDLNYGDVEGPVKTVKYSVLYMKSIKALQEAMTRIEALEAEMAALKGAN